MRRTPPRDNGRARLPLLGGPRGAAVRVAARGCLRLGSARPPRTARGSLTRGQTGPTRPRRRHWGEDTTAARRGQPARRPAGQPLHEQRTAPPWRRRGSRAAPGRPARAGGRTTPPPPESGRRSRRSGGSARAPASRGSWSGARARWSSGASQDARRVGERSRSLKGLAGAAASREAPVRHDSILRHRRPRGKPPCTPSAD